MKYLQVAKVKPTEQGTLKDVALISPLPLYFLVLFFRKQVLWVYPSIAAF